MTHPSDGRRLERPHSTSNGGGLGSEISDSEFEAIFAKADATMPHTMGGTPLWVDRVVSWTVILVLLAIVVAVIYALTRLFGG